MKATKLIYLSLSALALSLGACSKDEVGETKPSIEVVKSNFSYTYEAGTGQIEVNADGFTVETDAPWLTATANGRTIALSLEKNEGAESRTANVIIKKGNDVQRVPITQMGVINVMSLSNLEFQRQGGEHRFPIDKMDSQPEFTSSESWLTAELVGQELVVRIAAFPVGHTDDRSATLRVRAGLFDRTITVAQKYGVPEYADLLGTYALEFSQWGGSAKSTMNVELIAKEQNASYTLRGLAADVTIAFNPATSALTIVSHDVAADGVKLQLWTADGQGWFTTQGSLVAQWNRDFTTPVFTFSSTNLVNGESGGVTKDWPIRGFIFWGQSEYKGPSGTGISRVVDFKLTKQ